MQRGYPSFISAPRPQTIRRVLRFLLLMFVPVGLWASNWIDMMDGVLLGVLFLTLIIAMNLPASAPTPILWRDSSTGLPLRDELIDYLDDGLADTGQPGCSTCVMVVGIDRFRIVEERFSHDETRQILAIAARRIAGCLRETDMTARLDGPVFGVGIRSGETLELDTMLRLAGRIQRKLSERIRLGEITVNISASVGLCLPDRVEDRNAKIVLQAANAALIEAQRQGPAAIRSYSDAMRERVVRRSGLAREVVQALEGGDLLAYFQPQVSSATGQITGVETLARWHHPERGLVPPAEFLPAIENAGMMDRLCELMVSEGLRALKTWDELDLGIPRIGINFSPCELGDPKLVDHITGELDRYGIAADRLVIEVLENVVADRTDDIIIRNLASLSKLGCCLDLDDFGTGHASITSIRRFAVQRIKIDRTFITGIDEDPEQQRMVGAILTMAGELNVDTLAEGVETEGELTELKRLGCGHIQGYVLARPMPIEETAGWIARYRSGDGAIIRQLRAV
ncbi:GGDEF domain-containing protein [Ponticoccus sp. SC2-23]|uniref:putative bifunctional diguanylate cyclase/phosphodiesterase n=1 Tax=Alexandriicola marinus TaxID=2081710 RepID=UPI000FD8D69C|nr:bifunctional diguanylate cyclase/phosphodiesterase [Alexandriicola marinus]MBM1222075.1 GGDEF domain-containing protein [Ponticoccus sp. SC6-9]MBM1226762.1 GGDEF domain-containing protein [Ponticoccus sp. SC6-15]MBM1231022.1 GGDEF domain-containing protein [Ponticoccus sp. SC6-38]MBM1235726.1 GGDEF domain-containing protein [Ponticoccus sp. SC6-45]MBM1240044.1 GGDEF domain-containing protein [Ponticoccus sp. SC6-49]MBM1244398.1 GGDEF domain-containing protein [Ponticoccus sp. SC2-64]MBM12